MSEYNFNYCCLFVFVRQMSDGSMTQENSFVSYDDTEFMFHHDNSVYADIDKEWNNSPLEMLAAESKYENKQDEKDNAKILQTSKYKPLPDASNSVDHISTNRIRSDSTNSEFYSVDIEKDLKCKAKGCVCEHVNRSGGNSKCTVRQACATSIAAKEKEETTGATDANAASSTKDAEITERNDWKEGCEIRLCNDDDDGGKENSGNICDTYTVKTDRSSTLCDQHYVTADSDNHSYQEEGQREIDESSHVNSVSQSNEDDLSVTKVAGKPLNEEQTLDNAGFISSERVNREDCSEISNNLVVNNRNETIQLSTAHSKVSSDSGIDVNNIHHKHCHLDFDSKCDKDDSLDFSGNSHDKHCRSRHDESKSSTGTEAERSAGMDVSKRRKWKFMHPFKNVLEGELTLGEFMLVILCWEFRLYP